VATVSMILLRINLPETLHFFASLLGGMLLYHRSPCPDIIWRMAFPQKIFGVTAFSTFPLDYTTVIHVLLIKLKTASVATR